tara:strand:- start:212 stop:373 length:162 start_codon:yes stop_codon:yes gene_type:complete
MVSLGVMEQVVVVKGVIVVKVSIEGVIIETRQELGLVLVEQVLEMCCQKDGKI